MIFKADWRAGPSAGAREQGASTLVDPTKSPNPIDIAVGARVKATRVAKGISQANLAQRLRLTFQQVQKYERGANRISASKIVEIAQTLGVDPAVFFKGLGARGAEDIDFSFFSAPGITELLVAYRRLSPREQRALLRLAHELGDTEDESSDLAALDEVGKTSR